MIQKQYGTTFQKKRTQARISAACILLKTTSYSLSEIAEQTGYSSPEHFSYAFRQQMGCTPGTYRRKNNTKTRRHNCLGVFVHGLTRAISRVMSGVIIYLVLMLPPGSSDLPESRRATVCFLFGLASDGVYTAFSVTRQAVVSYTAFSPLPLRAVIFCCTFLGVTSTGRYPASCPMKPGLSSPAAFRFCSRDHLSCSNHA